LGGGGDLNRTLASWRTVEKRTTRRALLAAGGLSVVAAVAADRIPVARTVARSPAGPSGRRPVALVYRGPAACDGCAEAAANLLGRQRQDFVIRYIGRRERVQFSAEPLARAQLYVQPGGNDDLDQAWRQLLEEPGFTPGLIPDFVRGGGRYLGLCMGGYLAGSTGTGNGGFQFLPGDSGEYVGSAGADVTTLNDTLVGVSWLAGQRPRKRTMYFQDAPYFWLDGSLAARRARVLARYRNKGADKKIAMVIVPYGRGKVGASGPHPEATPDWYVSNGLPSWHAADEDIGDTLISTLMR
jgi:glutamine amidotransferase-like uncharacterized protein